MKRCNNCEATFPYHANICSQCGTVLPDAQEVTIRHVPILVDERTVANTAIMPEVEEMTIKGLTVLNPETPLSDPTVIENLITDDPTPTLPAAYDEKAVTSKSLPALLAEDANVITDDPPPLLPAAYNADAILDDPAPTSLAVHDADVITGNPTPLVEHQSDTAIIRADAPISDTDPHLSSATIDALAILSDQGGALAPENDNQIEQLEESETLPIASFLETGEETPLQNGHAIPAPLYPDYGKANNAPPSPLYEDYKSFSISSTVAVPTKRRNTTSGYPPIWSWRALIAIALCLLITLGTIGLFITKKPQTRSGPTGTTIAAKLRAVSPSLASEVVKGHKVVLAAAIANDGGQALRWTADTGQTTWLSVDKNKSNGIIQAGAPQSTIYARVDATSLDVGNYSGALQIHSNGGNASILITLKVIPANGKLQPIMNVDPTVLTFGSLQQGQQATMTIYINNAGTATLNWKANVGNVKWITLTPQSGTILAGGDPQPLAVTVNTTGLTLGLSPANLNLISNAGGVQPPVTITVDVTAASGNALTISANPGSFTNGCLNCTVMLSASPGGPGSQSSVQWSTSGVGVPGITFNPSSDTLQAGQSIPVTVTVPNTTCPASANFNFASAANTVSVVWSCTPPPTPNAILTASPIGLSNCYTCTVYISPAAGSQSTLKWSSTSSGINGITINPPSGTVAAGRSQAVTVTVPNTNCPSNANSATLTFSGQGAGNSNSVSWTCTSPSQQAPQLSVSPTMLDSSQCTANNNNTYNCTVTLSESPAGNLSWSSYSNVGGNFSQSSGNFTSGSTSANISINNIQCQNGSFGFTGTNTSAVVQWTCKTQQTPTLSVNPTSLNANSSSCSSDGNGGYTCNVTLSENPQGTLAWHESDNLGVSVSPQNGTLTPGNSSIQISLISIPCQSTGTNDTFDFSSTGSNSVSVNWSCTAPPTVTIPAAPSNIAVTATDANTILVTWSDNSNNEAGFTVSDGVTPVNVAANTTSYTWGGLSAGTYKCVHVLAYNSAGSSAWTPYACTTTPSIPAMLSVSSSSYPSASGCSYTSGSGWTCTETLSVNSDATQNLNWNVTASSSDIQFSSIGSTMTPGQTLSVTITIPDRFCPVNESFLFTATNQVSGINVNWNCNATLAYSWGGCITPDNGLTYLCNINLYLATGSQGKMSWSITTSTSSDKILPYSQGTLTPSSTDLITVQTGCYDTITIVGTGNPPMTQIWKCQ